MFKELFQALAIFDAGIDDRIVKVLVAGKVLVYLGKLFIVDEIDFINQDDRAYMQCLGRDQIMIGQ